MVILLVLFLYVVVGVISYQVLFIRRADLQEHNIFVPDYEEYDGGAMCGVYSCFWILSIPVTLFHQYVVKKLQQFIKDF